MQRKRIIIGVFFIWIFGMSLISLILPKISFSRMENRCLAEFPAVTLSNIADGSFEERFESYLNDHFVARDFFVRLSKYREFVLGSREFGNVYYGGDATLLRKLSYDQRRLEKNTEAIRQYAARTKLPVELALIPGAVDLQSEKLPADAPNYNQKELIREVYAKIERYVNCIDLYSSLQEHRDAYIFYRTDHHWTSLGAFYGYEAYAKALGLPYTPVSEREDTLYSDHFYGTLYADAPFSWIQPDEIHAYVPDDVTTVSIFDGTKQKQGALYAKEHLTDQNQYTVFLGGNQPVITIYSPAVSGERLLVIRDSYVDSMAPFLTENYAELHLIDPRYYKESIDTYITEHEIDKVLICMSLSSYMENTGIPLILSSTN